MPALKKCLPPPRFHPPPSPRITKKAWARYDLSPEQSQAAFAMVDLLARYQTLGGRAQGAGEPHHHGGHGDRDGARRTGATVEGVGAPVGADADCKAPDKYAMTKSNIRAVRKQAGASRWAIRLGRFMEGALANVEAHDVTQETMHLDPELRQCATQPVHTGIRMKLALEVWSVVLRTEEGAMALFKDRPREAKAK